MSSPKTGMDEEPDKSIPEVLSMESSSPEISVVAASSSKSNPNDSVASTSKCNPSVEPHHSSHDAVASTSSIDDDCCYVGEGWDMDVDPDDGVPIKMTKLNFSANISTMFTELPFLERFKKAKECGFETVEIQNPYEYSIEELVAARGDMKIDLVNSYNGNHEMGMAANPHCVYEFTTSIQYVIRYEFLLGFRKLHVMSGMRLPQFSYEEQHQALVHNLKNLVDSDVLENRNMIAVIEPISPSVKAGYFLNDFNQALSIIKEVGSDQVKLLLDIYHLHELNSSVSRYLPRYYKAAGHIQVSQAPDRGHPFSDGDINYDYVFKYLQRRRHKGVIGLECFSSGNPEDYASIVNGCW